jgi:hypothetical protein
MPRESVDAFGWSEDAWGRDGLAAVMDATSFNNAYNALKGRVLRIETGQSSGQRDTLIKIRVLDTAALSSSYQTAVNQA